MLELEGTTLGYYQLQRRLARGGMSEVYLATDNRTQRTVAIKLVNHNQEEHFRRFQRELKALEKLDHRHILPTYDYGEHDSWSYYVMPYIEHGTLREKLAEGSLSLEEVGIILEQLASALQFAHDQGILHRDIKPSNMLVKDDTHIYLADFGLAKEIGDCTDVTLAGCLIGTPDYMAPELMEEPASIQSDIYALGVMLYHMLTGRVPFKASTPIAVYWKHIKEQPPFPADINPAITPEVEEVILHAMEKNPEDRFSSVREMAEAYKQALSATVEETAKQMVPSSSLGTALTLDPVVQRVIPIGQIGHVRQRARHIHPAFVMAAVFFLLLLPLSLGVSLYENGMQAPTALGASLSGSTVGTHEIIVEVPELLGNVKPSVITGTQATNLELPVLAIQRIPIKPSVPVGGSHPAQPQPKHNGHKHGHHNHFPVPVGTSMIP